MSQMILFNGITAEEHKEYVQKNRNINHINQLIEHRQEGIEKIENICNVKGWKTMHTGGTFLFNYQGNDAEIAREIFNIISYHRIIPVPQL
ncbi:hypothetical protein bcgnr5372_46210 [Bacillus luti]|nr:hypothetical protein [Bacillus cereus]HDR8330553.1 hypothetical protein [Bacillus cereus]HDR8338113.1 hypothetical protein [Bacillus cereus]